MADIRAGDVVQVNPSAPSDFAGCYCRVARVEGVHLVVTVPQAHTARCQSGLVLACRVQRVGRSVWFLPEPVTTYSGEADAFAEGGSRGLEACRWARAHVRRAAKAEEG